MWEYVLATVLVLLNLVLIAATSMMAIMSVMMLAAGPSVVTWAKFIGIWAIPVIGVIALIAGLIRLLAYQQTASALQILAVPFAYAALFAIFFVAA